MSLISQCPQCDRRVVLPAGLDPAATVACPHCAAEYPLAAAAAAAEEVPSLMAVGAAVAISAGSTGEGDWITPDEELGTAPVSLAADAAWEAEAEVSVLTADEKTGQPDEFSTADTVKGLPPQARAAVVAELPDESPAGFAIDTGEDPAAAAVPLAQRARSGPPRRGKQKSVVGELIGIVFGGAGGLLIAYWVLNFFWGPRFDFLEIPLPFAPHTYKHWPGAKEAPSPEGDTETPAAPRRQPARELTGRAADFAAMAQPAAADVPAAGGNPAAKCPTCDWTGRIRRVVFQGTREINGEEIALERAEEIDCPDCQINP